MRKALICIAIAIAAGSLAPAGAAGEIAKCDGTTGLTGATYYPTVGGACHREFTVGQSMAVAVNLLPSPTFTGTLRGRVTGGTAGGTPVTGVFVNGALVSGLASGIAYLTPTFANGSPITWKLTITAGDPMKPCSPYAIPPVSCSPTELPTLGFGAFGGSITPAPAG